jgi:hypothetical protein
MSSTDLASFLVDFLFSQLNQPDCAAFEDLFCSLVHTIESVASLDPSLPLLSELHDLLLGWQRQGRFAISFHEGSPTRAQVTAIHDRLAGLLSAPPLVDSEFTNQAKALTLWCVFYMCGSI